MCKLLDNCLAGLLGRAGIIKLGTAALLVFAATLVHAQPTNDNFANATVISNISGSISGSSVGATAEAGEPSHVHPGGPFASIWYKWTSPITGTMNFNTEGSSFDTLLAVYTGASVDALTVVASNDDVSFGILGSDLTSSVTFPVTNGTDYYIAVDGYGGDSGNVILNWSETGSLSAGTFQFASTSTASGGPTYVISEHETLPTVIEVHMTENGARARVTRVGGSAGLVHVAYTVTNTFFTNIFITNIFGTNVLAITTNGNVTNWTNIYITNISVTQLFAQNVQGSWVDSLGRLLYCTNTNGTTITITNDDSGFGVTNITNYPNPFAPPRPCRNTNFVGTVTNTSGSSNVIQFTTNIFCTNIVTIVTNPSATPFFDYIPTNGVLDFKDYQMGADIPVVIFPNGGLNNRVVIVTLNSATLDPLEPTNLISPPIVTSASNALVNVLMENALGTQPDLCATTNLIFNLDKTVWTCTESVNGLNSATVFVVRGGTDFNATGTVQYDIDFGNAPNRNHSFQLQPGSDYATPIAVPPDPVVFPPSSQPGDFTNISGTVNIGARQVFAAISIPIVDDTIVEFNEDMHIRLHDPSGGALGQITTATLTILFDDQPAGAIDRDYNPEDNANTAPVPFNSNPGANKSTYACVIQPDGRAIIGGDFTAYNTIPINSVARINANGLLDQSFVAPPNSGANGTVNCLALDTNNNVYIGGSFSSFNGTNRGGVARLNPDGSLDATFNPGVGVNVGGTVKAMVLQPDGRLIISGSFNTVNATNRYNIARLNTNGTLDLTFNPGTGPNGAVSALALQTNGSNISVIIGGGFTLVTGTPRAGLARLNPDGSLDTTFDPGAGTDPNTAINAVAVQSDGKVLVGGSFNTFNLITSKSLVRLTTNGMVDASFNVGQGADNSVNSIVLQPDATILIGGMFTSYNETRRIGVARLLSTGALDTSFMDTAYNQFAGVINTYYSSDVQPKNSVNCMALQPDGNIIIAGTFNHIGGGLIKNAAFPPVTIPARDGFTPRQNFARLIGGSTGGPGNIGLAYNGYNANENGGNAFVTMNRSNGHLGPGGVTVSATDPPAGPGAAVAGKDYSFDTNYANPIYPSSYAAFTWMVSDGMSGPNNIPVDDVGGPHPGLAGPQVFITAIDNSIVDGNRSLNLTLTDPTSADIFFLGNENIPIGTALDTITAAPMEIIDNDAPHGVISFSAPTYTVDQTSGTAVININRAAGSAGQISFTALTVTGGTAVPGTTNDYLSVSNVIILADSITNTTLKIPVINNGVAKPDVTVFLLITNITGGATPGLTNAVLTIINDNFSSGHLQFTSTNFGANETGGSALVTVSRTGGSSGSISVSCASSNGTAANGLNYSASTNILSWNAGDVSPKTFTVPLLHDGQVTSNLTVNLRLYNPIINGGINNAALGSQSNAVLTITNMDFYGQPTLSAAAYNVNENAGFVTITVNRIGGTAQTMTVNYATSDGTAFQNFNYTGVSGTLVFPPGVFSTNFTIPIIDDNPPAQNGNTTFTVTLSGATPASGPGGGVQLGNPSIATVTIIDNETYNQPAGTVDKTYEGYFNNIVYSLALQTNGQLLAGGDFTTADGITRNRIARLNTDGSLDEKFATQVVGADNSVRTVLSQSDGRVLIGGLFGTVNTVNRAAIARLNYDGTVDTGFNPGAGADSPVYAIGEMFVGPVTNTNRRIVVGGSFSKIGGVPSPNIGRFKDDGSVDMGFSQVGASGTVYAIAVYSTNDINSGKILIGGDFTQIGGVTRQHIARLNMDGTLDASFNPGAGPNGSVRAIAIQQDGNIVLGGLFTMVGNVPLNHVGRIMPNGLVDSSFNPGLGANDVVNCLAIQEDHKIVMGGFFTSASGVPRNRLTRLNPDGSLDLAINFGDGANDFVTSVVIQSDERLVVGGAFTQFADMDEPHIARLYGLTTPGPGTLTFTSTNYLANDGGTNVVITVRRDGGTGDTNIGNVYVDFSTSDGTGVAGTDYIGVTNTLTFPVGIVFQTVTIPILSNSIVQSDRTVNLTLSNPTDAALGIQPSSILTIVNNNSDVNFSAADYRVSKSDSTGEAVITVLRNGSSVGAASVDLITGTNGTAIPGVDYVPLTNTVLFADGEVQETVAINIITNAMPGNRTVSLALSNPTNTIVTDPDVATLTIVDDSTSPGFVMFASTNYFVSELATNAIINLIRTNGTHNPVSVKVSTGGGTAIPGTDYAPTNVSVGFDDGASNASFMVQVFYNPQVTGNRTVNLTMSSPSNGVQIVPPLTVPLTIQDADTGFAFDQPAYFIDETNGLVTIGVDRIGSTNGFFTVQYSTTNGTAVAGTNYVGTNGTLTFPPGQTFQTFSIPILNDPRITGNKVFFVQLSSPSSPGQLANPAVTAVTVLDDNTGLAFTTASNSVSEAGTNIVLSVVRTGSSIGAIAVNFATSDGTATNGVRYIGTNGVLPFADGQTSNTIVVRVINDNLVEGDQTFNVTLSGPTAGAQLLSPSTQVITVIDDDSAFNFTSANYSVTENGVTALITAVRTGVTNTTVSVNYATSNLTAIAGVHYVATNGTLTFTNGQTSASFGVNVIDNNVTGGSEALALNLSNPTPATNSSLAVPSSALLTIFNDDGSLIVPAGTYLVSETGPGASNGVINPGDTVTIMLALRNSAGTNTTANFQATLLATNGILAPSPSTPVTYGVLVTNGPSVARQFQFSVGGTNGSLVSATLHMQDGAKDLGFANFNFILGLTTTYYTNTNYITINDNAAATPYPSAISISSLPGQISKVTATVSNLAHAYMSDVSMLLVGPGGQKDLLMAHVGGNHTATNVTLTFDDSVNNFLTTNTPVTGTYAPTAYTTAIPFPGPAPSGPYNTNFTNLVGGSANGSWSLYVFDDKIVDVGSINNGWSLAISSLNVVAPTVNLTAGMIATANPSVVGSNLTYNITLTNSGPAPASGVAITDILPPGSALVSSTPPGSWSVSGSNSLVCTVGALPMNSNFTASVTIVPSAVGSITNTITASANEADANATDNVASVVTTINPPSADLAVGVVDSPDPVLVGNTLTYSILVTNLGPATATNVVVTNTLPPGVALLSVNPPGGSSSTNGGVITVTYGLGTIGSGGTGNFAIMVEPKTAGLINNLTTVGSSVFDPLKGNNTANVKTQVNFVQLVAAHSGSNLVFSWPVGAGTYTLQSSPTINPSAWTAVATPVVIVNGQNTVTVPLAGGPEFFRLIGPAP